MRAPCDAQQGAGGGRLQGLGLHQLHLQALRGAHAAGGQAAQEVLTGGTGRRRPGIVGHHDRARTLLDQRRLTLGQTFATGTAFIDAVAASLFVEIFVASDETFRHPVSRRWCVGWRCAGRARQTGALILLGGDVAGWLV